MSATTKDRFRWFATNDKQEVEVVRPRRVIMGDWWLCRNREGDEWFIPSSDLKPIAKGDGKESA